MKSACRFLFGISSLLIMSTIFSLPQSHAVHELFKSIDENADGTINQEEFSKDMKDYVFNKLDNNNNKAISKAEWMGINNPLEAEQHEVLFQEIDKNKDKLITFFEFSDYAERHSNIEEAFIGLDRDGSNSLSPDEITIRPLFRMITIKFK